MTLKIDFDPLPASPPGDGRLPGCPAERGAGARPSRATRALQVAIAAGLLARVLIALLSLGTNDFETWKNLGAAGRASGLFELYRATPDANHPPLPLLWAMAVSWLSARSGVSFPFLFKLAPIAADAGSAWLVYRAWWRRAGPSIYPLLAAAIFAWNPVALLVSGYHCNTDPACARLCLLAAALLQDRRAPLAAGAALGAAINVKLIPIVLVAPLALWCPPRWRPRFLLGLSAGAVPFLPVLLFAGRAFYAHAIAYTPVADNWGLLTFVIDASRWQPLQARAESAFAIYRFAGRYVILVAAAAIGWGSGRGTRRNAYEVTALVLATFLVFVPGFGLQYLVYVVPALAAVALDASLVYGLLGGAFALSVYAAFSDGKLPAYSHFDMRFPPPTELLGLFAWCALVAYLFRSTVGRSATWKALRGRAGTTGYAVLPSDDGG